MTRTQIQLPDALYVRAKRIAKRHEISLAELIRRGLEHIIELYPLDEKSEGQWELPSPRALGEFLSRPDDWRELANTPEP
ncbi:MAG TPA: antitoxin [Vicinamibacteria bacterium]|nr:antitoxin [Vicinamibacteria bacterium]